MREILKASLVDDEEGEEGDKGGRRRNEVRERNGKGVPRGTYSSSPSSEDSTSSIFRLRPLITKLKTE